MTDIASIEKSIETIVAEAEAAIAPIEALLTVLGPFLPASVKGPAAVAIATIKALQTAAPTLVADLEKVGAELEAVIAAIHPAA